MNIIITDPYQQGCHAARRKRRDPPANHPGANSFLFSILEFGYG